MQAVHQILHALYDVGSCLLLGGSAGVNPLSVVLDDLLDEALLLEVDDGAAGKRTVDLHAVNEDRLGDKLVGGNLLHDTVAEGSARVLPAK